MIEQGLLPRIRNRAVIPVLPK